MKINYVLNTEEGASLYFDGTRTIVDIDIPDGAETITFTAEKSGSKICSYYNVFLRGIKKQFPDVKEIIIGKDITNVTIDNEMFPNVRKVTSKSVYYKSGTMLIFAKNDRLDNTFCLQPDETIDVSGIKRIGERAFSGCLSTKMINAEKVDLLYPNAFDGSMFLFQPYKNNLIMVDKIMISVNPTADEIAIDDSIKIILSEIDFSKVKKLHVSKFQNIEKLSLAQAACIKELYIDESEKIDAIKFDTMKNYHLFENLKKIYIKNDNKWFKTIDGIVYSADGKTLVFCPSGKTGFVDIPDGTEKICDRAFANSKISGVSMPDSMREIGGYAFINCPNLEHIDFGCGIDRLGTSNRNQIMSNCNKMKRLEIPSQVKYISFSAFANQNIEKLILNEGLLYIDAYAFSGNNINEVILPSSLKSLGTESFLGVHKVIIPENCRPSGLISAIVKNSKQVTYEYEKSEDIYSEITTVEQKNENTVYFPACMTTDSIAKSNMEYSLYGFDKEYIKKLYEFGVTSEAKQNIAMEIYDRTKEPEIAAYLRRIGGSFAKRLLKDDKQERLIQFLKMGLMTENAMRKILKEAEANDATMVSAYILKTLDDTKTSKTSFRL